MRLIFLRGLTSQEDEKVTCLWEEDVFGEILAFKLLTGLWFLSMECESLLLANGFGFLFNGELLEFFSGLM
jgi:hypothetical protein